MLKDKYSDKNPNSLSHLKCIILFQMAFREVEQTVKNLKIEATGMYDK